MRQDQIQKLNDLTEKLADAVLIDADPERWIGYGKSAGQMTKEERGDAYWCRKVAAATISVLKRVENVVSDATEAQNGGAELNEDAELEKEMASAEREAELLLDQLQRRIRKAEFDKRVHGANK
jgi:hypothetical protein